MPHTRMLYVTMGMWWQFYMDPKAHDVDTDKCICHIYTVQQEIPYLFEIDLYMFALVKLAMIASNFEWAALTSSNEACSSSFGSADSGMPRLLASCQHEILLAKISCKICIVSNRQELVSGRQSMVKYSSHFLTVCCHAVYERVSPVTENAVTWHSSL